MKYFQPASTTVYVLKYFQVLLDASVYINRCDRNGCTPVYKAAFHGRPALIEILTRSGKYIKLSLS